MITASVSFSLKGFEKFIKATTDPQGEAAKRIYKVWGVLYRSFAQRRFDVFSKGGGTWAPLKQSTIQQRRGAKKFLDKAKKLKEKIFKLENKLAGRSGGSRGFKLKFTQRKNITTVKAGFKLGATAKRFFTPKPKKLKPLTPKQRKAAKKQLASAKKQLKKLKFKVAILRDKGLLFNALTPTVLTAGGIEELLSDGGVRVGYGGNASHDGDGVTIADIAGIHQRGNKKRNLPARKIIVPPDEATNKRMVAAANKVLKEINEESFHSGTNN